ncbi:MAG TPA: septum formation initiator family protein [bacterium]|nr:septum formation initiator family protein [bacterium]
MSNKYNLSPTEKLNYVHKGEIKGQKGRVLKQSLFLVFIIGMMVLILFPYLKNKKKKIELENEIAKIREDINQYEKNNEDLREFLSYLESDQAIEEKARLNLGLQKEGEKVVVIKKIIKDEVIEGENKELDEEELTNPQKWIKYFFDN